MNLVSAIIFLIVWLVVNANIKSKKPDSLLVRCIGHLVFILSAIAAAMFQSYFLEVGACIDAGGIFTPSGLCQFDVPNVDYVPQLSRPNLYLLWATFVINICAPSWLLKLATTYLLGRLYKSE